MSKKPAPPGMTEPADLLAGADGPVPSMPDAPALEPNPAPPTVEAAKAEAKKILEKGDGLIEEDKGIGDEGSTFGSFMQDQAEGGDLGPSLEIPDVLAEPEGDHTQVAPEGSEKPVEELTVHDMEVPDDDPFMTEIRSMGKHAKTAQQMAAVKKLGNQYLDAYKKTKAELEELRNKEPEAPVVDNSPELELLKKQVEDLEKERDEAKSNLSRMDLQYDDEFQNKFVSPVNTAREQVTQMLGLAGQEVQQAAQITANALQAQDPQDYFQGAVQASEFLPEPMRPSFFAALNDLRTKSLEMNKATEQWRETSADLGAEKKQRYKKEADRFMREDFSREDKAVAEALPNFEARLYSKEFEDAIGESLPAVQTYEKNVEAIIADQVSTTGTLNPKVAQIAGLAKRTFRMAHAYGSLLGQINELNKENAELKEAFQKGTGKALVGSGGGTGGSTPEKQEEEPASFGEFALRNQG